MLLAAFLVPFVLVCDFMGVGLLATLPQGGSWVDIAVVILETLLGIAVLGLRLQGCCARARCLRLLCSLPREIYWRR
jgi:hypothetical protein